jgi:integrase
VHLGTFDTRREAAAAEAQHKLKARPLARETIESFAGRWLDDYPRPRRSSNTSNAERIKPLIAELGSVRLADVSRPMARAWALKHRWALPAARAMFADAMNDGLVDVNPFAGLRLPGSEGRKRIVALTEAELQELAGQALRAWPDDGWAWSYRAMILFAGYVGLRPGELFALRRSDVVGDLCVIERALESKSGEVGPTKTGRVRTVTVPPVARDAVAELPPNSSGLLFESRRGQMWRQPSHHHCWKVVRAMAGRPGLDFYELRHCAATMLLERGMTPWMSPSSSVIRTAAGWSRRCTVTRPRWRLGSGCWRPGISRLRRCARSVREHLGSRCRDGAREHWPSGLGCGDHPDRKRGPALQLALVVLRLSRASCALAVATVRPRPTQTTDLKEATMLKTRILPVVVGIAAMIVPVFNSTSLTSTADAAVHRKSAACKSPEGQKINISWGQGNVTTTVYFNNHCAQKRAIQLQFVRENHTEFYKCITVNPKTKGKKKIQYGNPNEVTLPAKC